MPKILNTESNVEIEINLMNNSHLDLDNSREDFMNWIPFNLKVSEGNMILTYSRDVLLSFSERELKYLFVNLNRIVEIKSKGELIEAPFEFTSSENLFDLDIYETGEENLIYFEIWFDMGVLTNGTIYGFSKGIKFIVELDMLRSFVIEFENQFVSILKESTF